MEFLVNLFKVFATIKLYFFVKIVAHKSDEQISLQWDY